MPADFCAKDLEYGRVGEFVNGVDVGVAGEPQRHLIPPRTYHLATFSLGKKIDNDAKVLVKIDIKSISNN